MWMGKGIGAQYIFEEGWRAHSLKYDDQNNKDQNAGWNGLQDI